MQYFIAKRSAVADRDYVIIGDDGKVQDFVASFATKREAEAELKRLQRNELRIV